MNRTLGMRVDLVHVDSGVRADIAVKNRSFRVIVVYVPNDQTEHCSFFRQLGAISGRSGAPSFNGGLPPGPQVR